MNIVPMADGFGGRVGDRSPMPARPGTHSAYARGSDLIVEWYDHGPNAPYESANLLIFDRATQRRLAETIGVDPALSPHRLSNKVAARFDSYFDVRRFAETQGLAFTTEVDFEP